MALVGIADSGLTWKRVSWVRPVHIWFSKDNGETWDDEIALCSGDGVIRDAGYPENTQKPDGN